MTRLSGSGVVTAVLLATSAACVFLALDLGPGTRVVPSAVAGSLLCLLVLQAVHEGRSGTRAPAPVAAEARLERAAIAWLAGLGALILAFGVSLGTPLFVSLYLRRRGREAWPAVAAAGAATAVALWLVMTQVIGARPSLGALERLAALLPGTPPTP